MSTQTLPIHFVQRLTDTAQHRGMNVSPALAAATVHPELLRNPQARITYEQAHTLTRALWDVTDDELWGLGPAAPRGTLRMLGGAMVHASDLRGALQRAVSGSRVLSGAPPVRVISDGHQTRIEFDFSHLDDPHHLVTETLLLMAVRLTSWTIARGIGLHAVELPYPAPQDTAYYEQAFGRQPMFDQPCPALVFAAELLAAPIVRSEAELLEFLRGAPMSWLVSPDYGMSPADRVRAILERGLSGEWPAPDDIAASLSISVQHLRRQLRDESTSISKIREGIVRDAAIRSLESGTESVDDLAVRLGFSETSAFRRAFRRWTGSPPGAYQRSAE